MSMDAPDGCHSQLLHTQNVHAKAVLRDKSEILRSRRQLLVRGIHASNGSVDCLHMYRAYHVLHLLMHPLQHRNLMGIRSMEAVQVQSSLESFV